MLTQQYSANNLAGRILGRPIDGHFQTNNLTGL